MREFIQMANQTGNTLTCAGIGLETIGSLMGADGAEHYLNTEDMNGLHHTVIALGGLIKAAGYNLCIAAEEAQEKKGVDHA